MAEELFKNNGGKSTKSEIVFNTPIVIYSWKPIVDSLKKNNIAYEKDGVNYVNMSSLGEMMRDGKNWQDIGVNLYGNLIIKTTDPNESNSGNMFLGLLANALNGNKPVTKSDVGTISQDLKKIYTNIGYMESSSKDIFTQYLHQGMGAYPMIAGYENQLLEFSVEEPGIFDRVKDNIVILYPDPTVWSSHIFISLNDKTNIAIDVFKDKEIQELSWKRHGFRTIVSGAEEGGFSVKGLAKEVNSIMQMPSIEVMEELMRAIK